MASVAALRHVAFEDLGLLGPLLAQRGHTVRYVDAGVDDPCGLDPDLLVVLGGPVAATDDAAYPFLADEARLLERRLEAGKPTLGICLGAQLMARALGAQLVPAAEKEIGWAPITLTEAGAASCLRHVGARETRVLHWHGDAFELPAGAVHLASTPACGNQAFSWGDHALALQFHIEAAGPALERWFIGHTVEIGLTPGVSVPELRADSQRWSPELIPRAEQCLGEWLAGVGL